MNKIFAQKHNFKQARNMGVQNACRDARFESVGRMRERDRLPSPGKSVANLI